MLTFCLNSRVSLKYRKKAQELYIEYRDFSSIENYLTEEWVDTILIVDTPANITDEQAAQLQKWAKVKNNIICALHDEHQLGDGRLEGLLWYIMKPCNSFEDAKAIQEVGAQYIVLGETLFFNINRLKNCGIRQIRIMANQAMHSIIPRKNGLCGPWMRPEDAEMYDVCPNVVIEFPGCMPSKEEALYRIYAEQHRWPGELDRIIDNIGISTPNRMLPSEFTEHRLNCRQRCESCHICPNLIKIADKVLTDGDDIKLFLEKK